MPEDLSTATPSAEGTQETATQETQNTTVAETTETTQGAEQTGEQATPQQTIKVRFNHEEREIPLDEAVLHIQKGLNYDKVNERLQVLQNDPGTAYLKELADQSGMTVEQYVKAARDYQEQQRLEQLINEQQVPESVAREIMENRKFRQQWEADQKTRQAEERQKADYLAFVDAYPDVRAEEIPGSVWAEVDKGKSLVDAYQAHENQQLKGRIAKLEETLQIRQKNEQNKESSPGSVTGNGDIPTGYFSRDQIEKMSTKDIKSNLDAIMASMKKRV